jgi:Asp-tRNA(Asn)/Glu-tRNA(Gln) amidotransferase A subunit family amidase
MTEPLHATVTETLRRLGSRELSAVELMEATLARIDATHEKLNAFVALRDREALLADARAADERLARREGRALEGIPLGVKDLEDAEGLVTSEGSVPFKDHLAERDSVQVARLRAAGAIVVGKTNAPEFGYTAITKNLLFGASRNPWNLERSPGGSSGGSSAAIAGGVIPLVTASDDGLLWTQAELRPHPPRGQGDVDHGRHVGGGAAHAQRRGRGAPPRRDRRPAPPGPELAPAPGPRLRR